MQLLPEDDGDEEHEHEDDGPRDDALLVHPACARRSVGSGGRADGVRGGCQDGASARTRDGGGRTYRLIICFSVPLARPIDVSAVPSCDANK